MPLILPGNVGSATAATGYNVANSCRFNDDDSAYMHFTPGSGNRRTFTISMWVKRAKLGEAYLWGINNGTNPYTQIVFDANDKLYINDYDGGEDTQLITTQTFRDVAAWYHIVIAYDTTQSTAANRVKLYINGTRVTSFATETYPAQNFDTEWNNGVQQDLGKFSTSYGDYYLAEVCMVEDSQLAPDQFGEFDSDSGIWKPIDVSGLTFNTEGFYLDFEDSGDLGDDESGNGNDFTEVNLAATDQSIDTCTNNFATMNPLDNFHQGTAFSEGNLKLVYTSGNRTWNTCNVALSSGKWYCEILKGETNNDKIGIHYKLSAGLTDRADSDGGAWSYLGGKNADDGGVKTGGSTITYTIAPSDSGDIVGIFLDLDNNKLYFSVNGTVAHSGVGIDIPAASTLENGHYYIFGGSSNTSETMTHTWNFGSPAVALSSGVTDANGFGNFEYTPSGTFDSASKDFLAICTKNLAENS